MMAIARMSPSPAATISARFISALYRLPRRSCHLDQDKRKPRPCGRGFVPVNEWAPLLAIFARREVAAIDRLCLKFRRIVFPIGPDIRVRLDHGVPELVFLIAEHFFLFDLLDVDVLDRALGREIE